MQFKCRNGYRWVERNVQGLERDQRAWGDVADNVTKIPELKADNDGRKAWYTDLKGEDDTAWEDTEHAAKDLCFLSKLRMIAKKGNTHLDNLQKRWDDAKKLVTLHNKFRQIANTRGPGQIVLNLQLVLVEKKEVLDDIVRPIQK